VAELDVRYEDEVFYLVGDFDLSGVERFVEATSETLDDDDPVVLDLSELTFIDSSGLHAIVTLAERVGGRGFVLRNPRGTVARVFSIVRLEDIPGIDIEGRSG
jgi:anti-sigma B factor antagonist